MKKIVEDYLGVDNLKDDDDQTEVGSDPTKNAGTFMGLMNTLFKGIGGALAGIRNELYVNEYILMHFESAKPTGLTHSDDYKLENREVEYIIYGQHLPGANYGAALTQLFAIRYAINFIDAFKNEFIMAINEPLAKFLAILTLALKNTALDLEKLGRGGNVPLMEKMLGKEVLKMEYHGYLRLFLFMNPTSDARFQRIAALIEKDTGKDLTKQMTYVKGEVTTSKSCYLSRRLQMH